MPKKVTHRLERVSELLLRELAMLIRSEIADPRVKGITLTSVKMTPDLQHARIYFTVLDETQIKTSAHALNHAVSFLRRRVAQAIKFRVVPELFFVYDESLRRAQHITQILNSLPDTDTNKD